MTQLPMPGGWSGSDPMLDRYMQQQRQQQFWNMLAQVGQGLLSANRQGQPPLRALASGLAQAGGHGGHGTGGLLDWMKVRKYGQEQEAEKQYQGLISGGSGLDPATGIDWNAPRPGNPDLTKGMTPVQRGLLSSLPREQGFGLLAEQVFSKPQQPPTGFARTPAGLEPISGGPADIGYLGRKAEATQRPDRVTLSQQSSNAEIDQARATLDRRGLDKAEISRLTQKSMNSGRINKEYDEGLDRIVRMATQRKTGSDPDYRRYYTTYLGGIELSGPAGMAPLPPGMSTEESGLFQRGYDYLFGGDDAAAATGNPLIPPPLPSVGTTRGEPTTGRPISPRGPRGLPGRARQEAGSPPLLSNGGIDRSRLVVDQVYLHPVNGREYRWTGTEFVPAR